MGKNQSASGLTNVIQYSNGNITFVSGSTTLMSISSSGAITTTGVISGSNALSASYAANADTLDGLDSTVFTLTSSFNAQTASFTAFTASLNSFSASVLSYTSSANNRFSSIETVTGSNITRLGALEAATGSLYSYTSSLNLKTASFATTGSNTFIGTQTISGSVLQSGSFTTTGTIIAQTINVQTVTSSIVYSSGSNIFGNLLGDSQRFTGSVLVTGSLTIAGASSATSYSGATIYGSTAVCSPVGKFTTCIDAGSGTFSGALSGTCATFSSKLYADGNVRAAYLDYVPSGTETFVIGKASYNVFDGNQLAMGTFTALPIEFATNNVKRLTISSTGIASFTCQVCVPQIKIAANVNNDLYNSIDNSSSGCMATARFDLGPNVSSYALTMVRYGQNYCGTLFGDQAANTTGIFDNAVSSCGMYVGLSTATGALNFVTAATKRFTIANNGVACFTATVCAAGHVSSEDVRIYRSAGTTTGYINFGSTGTNYLGFDGTRFSINGSINAGGSTFSDTGDTCLVLRTSNSGNPRFKFCGGSGVFNRSTAADIMYFGESADTGLYLFRGGTLMSDKGACMGTYGFTHCGASRWGRFGMPNSSYMYLETNADSGFYIDGQTRVGGYFCASGNIQGGHIKAYSSICGNGVRLGGGSFNTGYTSDGIYGATATPNYIVGTGYNSGFYLGYVDNGSGLYGAAYAFNVKCSHGGGGSGTAEYDAIRMRNDESGVVPFRLTNWGNLYATSKNFRINHPLPSMNNTHHLIHTAIEGPQADLIYRGKVELINGRAEVNIDESSRMTEGTFELLCQNVQSYTTNESGWVLIKSYVIGNILHIEAQNETSDDIISWLVIGERKDDGMKNSNITDNDCHLVVETLIPELELES